MCLLARRKLPLIGRTSHVLGSQVIAPSVGTVHSPRAAQSDMTCLPRSITALSGPGGILRSACKLAMGFLTAAFTPKRFLNQSFSLFFFFFSFLTPRCTSLTQMTKISGVTLWLSQQVSEAKSCKLCSLSDRYGCDCRWLF